jgi:hypothetical protein
MMTAKLLIIIVAQVLLRDPTNELVIPLVAELSRRLSVDRSDGSGHDGSETEGRDLDDHVQSTMRRDHQGEQNGKIPGTHSLTWLYFCTNR